jgi:hypothetical protein
VEVLSPLSQLHFQYLKIGHDPFVSDLSQLILYKCYHLTLRNHTYLLTYLHSYLLNYLLHSAEYYLKSWLSLSLSKKILLSYGNWRFITVFTEARHWTLSWASRVQFAPSIPISICSQKAYLNKWRRQWLQPIGLSDTILCLVPLCLSVCLLILRANWHIGNGRSLCSGERHVYYGLTN